MREISIPKTIRTSIYFGQSIIDAEIRHAGLGGNGGASWPLGYITFDDTSFKVGYFSTEKKLSYSDIEELTATWAGNFKVKMKNNDDTFIFLSTRASLIFDKFI